MIPHELIETARELDDTMILFSMAEDDGALGHAMYFRKKAIAARKKLSELLSTYSVEINEADQSDLRLIKEYPDIPF